MKKILALILLTFFPLVASAQVYNPLWKLSSNDVLPSVSTWGLTVPSLGSGCLQADSSGDIDTTGKNCANGDASTTPGGSTNQIQYNGFGTFQGSNGFTFASTTGLFTAPNILASGSSTFQNFTGLNSTTSQATTTNLYVSGSLVIPNSSITNAELANSTISGIALGQNLASLTATDGTITFSGSYTGATARTIGINLSNANTWIGTQTFGTGAFTTLTIGGASVSPIIATTTASLGGGLLTAGNCASVSATTTSTISNSMAVAVTPVTYPGDGTSWDAYIGANNVVIVKVCALITVTPIATPYNIRVIP